MSHEETQPISEYQAFVKDKHERLFNTPPEIIDTAVKEAVGSPIANKERIIKGESNEVYSIVTEDGQELIARISRSSEPKFEIEKWAIEECAKVGVPVPKVLYIKSFELENKPLEISIQTKLTGIPLKEIEGITDPSHRDELIKILQETGSILSKIHSVPTRGFGELNKEGVGEFSTIQPVLNSTFYNEPEMLRIAAAVQLETNVMIQALQILKEGAANYPNIESRLTHNDFAPKHILVDEGKITGILDFEIVEGSDPVREFARWEFFTGDTYPIEALKSGYENKELFSADFQHRVHLWKVYLGVANLHYYEKEQNSSGIRLAIERLIHDVANFRYN